MENINSFFVPSWVKSLSLGLLILCVVISTYFVVNYIGKNNTDVLVIGLSLTQVSASALIILLIAFYSEQNITPKRLEYAAKDFVEVILPNAFGDLDFETQDFREYSSKLLNQKFFTKTRVKISKHSRNSALYKIEAKGSSIMMFVKVNVKSLLVIYFVPILIGQSTEEVKHKLKNCFDTTSNLGYNVLYYNTIFSNFDGLEYTEIAVMKNVESNFLINPFEKVHYSQDVCSMTHSFILESQRQKIQMQYSSEDVKI